MINIPWKTDFWSKRSCLVLARTPYIIIYLLLYYIFESQQLSFRNAAPRENENRADIIPGYTK